MVKNYLLNAVDTADFYLNKGIDAGASDIHFEPFADRTEVRFRLDGRLKQIDSLDKQIAGQVVTRLKVMAGLLTYRTDIPQEGRIAFDAAGRGVSDMRLAVFPTINGLRAVVRLFFEPGRLGQLEGLGFSSSVYDMLCEFARASEGLLMVAGPAGSGKSTTLGAVLGYIRDNIAGRSIISIEDPVERRIDGVTQIQVNADSRLDYPRALRSILRQDPEVIMLGEIRDAETARIAAQTGLTGHLVMTTMHAGEPASALIRLLEMGVEPYEVTSSVKAVVSQRLLRRLCPKCKAADGQGYFEATGCEYCLDTGYKGRVLAAEMVTLDGQLRKAILEKRGIDGISEALRGAGHMRLSCDIRRLLAEGLTSIDEARNVSGDIF